MAALGWDLAGSGRAFGFDRVSTLGDELARAAEQGDGRTVMRVIHALQRYLDALTLVFPNGAASGPSTSSNTEEPS